MSPWVNDMTCVMSVNMVAASSLHDGSCVFLLVALCSSYNLDDQST